VLEGEDGARPIAVVGFHGRFPGAPDPGALWASLSEGRVATGPVPPERWSGAGDQRGAFLTGVDAFDAGLFRISPREAEEMDPQQRLLLESVWSALEHAGRGNQRQAPDGRVGLFVGSMWHDYALLAHERGFLRGDYAGPGSPRWALANRISFALNLTGPSLAVDSACSSSLLAIHLACQSLQAQECELAVAGGVNLHLHPGKYTYLAREALLATSERKACFEAGAEGYLPGEGVGCVVLKPLRRALADGDTVHAIIRGSAANHNGGGLFFKLPNADAQVALLREALRVAQVEPSTVGYIELSAFGADLVDMVELGALARVFGEHAERQSCAVGSLKPNLGHLEAASGVAQLLKVILQLANERLLPTVFGETPPPELRWEETPFRPQRELGPWPRGPDAEAAPRRAGISSFGAGGTNVHLVVEEAPASSARRRYEPRSEVIVLSAADGALLAPMALAWAASLEQRADDDAGGLMDLAFTSQLGREAMAHRLAVVASSPGEAARRLRAWAVPGGEDRPVPGVFGGLARGPGRAAASGEATPEQRAAAWVAGANVVWASLYAGAEPRRVPAPTYPFARRRYWLGHDLGAVADQPAPISPPAGSDLRSRALVYLKALVGEEIKVPFARVDAGKPLVDYGLDSLMIKRLNARFARDLGELPATILFDHGTLDALADHLIARHADRVSRLPGAAATALLPPPALTAPPPERPLYEPGPVIDAAGPLEIAVIGVSGRYPMADSPAALWQNLASGRDCIVEVPPERWDADRFRRAASEELRAIYARWGGFLDGVDTFDPLFFGISPREAALIDPQERLFLEIAWEALEDAGYTPEELRRRLGPGAPVGVFVGAMWSEYQLYGAEALAEGKVIAPSSAFWSIPNRVSYTFDFHGPSMAVDTACSSSLTALHLACESLRRGESAAAIAGGVSLSLHPMKYVGLCEKRFASTDGKCRSFGAGGDGYVPGEGVGAVLLKPLARALADGDRILGVIRATHVSHGGKTNGYTVPSARAQGDLVAAALAKARIAPDSIGYIEAHGTGTSLGDPIEIEGLTSAFGREGARPQPCAIGSIKSNVGHLEAAAGIAGLTKVLLQLEHGQLAPSLNAETLNPNIAFARTPFSVQRELSPWPAPPVGGPRRAGVSSFGAGGANAHLIVEEAPPLVAPDGAAAEGPALILLSARTGERLAACAARLRDFLCQADGSLPLADIAYTLQVGRRALDVRWAAIVSSRAELIDALGELVDGRDDREGVFRGEVSSGARRDQALGALEEDRAYLESLLRNGRFARLAQLWVTGAQIEWGSLHAEPGRRRRVRLPTYAFARQRCWIPTTAAPTRAPAGPRCVERTLRPEDLILGDHRVNGQSVYPGVAILEWVVAEAGRVFWPGQAVGLRDVLWLRPVVVDAPLSLQLTFAEDGGRRQWRVESGDEGDRTVHATGTAERAVPAAPLPPLRIDELAARCGFARQPRADFYGRAAFRGLGYGTAFQSIGEVLVGRDEALARLERRSPDAAGAAGFLDGALQTLLALAVGLRPRVPFALARFTVEGPLPSKGWAHVRASAGDRFDVVLADEQGQVRACFDGLVAREPGGPALPTLFAPVWTEVVDTTPAPSARAGRVLLICPPEPTPLEVALAALEGGEVHRLRLGRRERRCGEREQEVPLGDAQALAAALGRGPRPDRIYHLAALESEPTAAGERATLDEFQERGVLTLFRLARALAEDLAPPVQLRVVTNRTHEVIPGETVRPLAAAVHGLTRCLASEFPHWSVDAVDVDLDEDPAVLAAFVRTAPPAGGGRDIAFRQGRRYQRMLVPVFPSEGPAWRWRDRGVYLIVGGAGGIGLVLAEHLARASRARLVLVGRSELSEGQRETIARIEALGGEVVYMRGDARETETCVRAVGEAKARWGALHGVVHSALVLRDQTVARMSEETFRAALDAKLSVAALASAVEGEELDFAALFSSAQVFMGTAGQGNYTAGCAFEDAYGRWWEQRVSYPVRVVNWGYWGSVGVVASAEYRRRLAAQGIASIEPGEGMAALEATLGQSRPQLVPFKATEACLRQLGVRFDEGFTLLPARGPSVTAAALAARARVPADADVMRMQEGLGALDRVVGHVLATVLRPLGLFDEGAVAASAAELRRRLSIADRYERLFRAWLPLLERAGAIEVQAERVRARPGFPADEAWRDELVRLEGELPALAPYTRLVRVCAAGAPEVLRGRARATDLLFPGGSVELVEGIYRGNPTAELFNRRVAAAVAALAQARGRRERLEVLEVGAGTGGTSAIVLDALEPFRAQGGSVRYLYTDVSAAFTARARAVFGTRFPFVEFATLDISRPLEEQGFAPGSFDVVLATNVLHTTRDVRQAVRQVKALLARRGWLVLNEVTAVCDHLTATFGLLEGWWMFEDEARRLPGAPLLSPASWTGLLRAEGFVVEALEDGGGGGAPEIATQRVFVAESDGWLPRGSAAPAPPLPVPSPSLDTAPLAPIRAVAPGVRVVQAGNQAERLETQIVGAIGEVLGLPVADVDRRRAFAEYGVDSIVGVKLVQRLNAALGVTMKTTALFDHGCVRDLARHLAALGAHAGGLDGEASAVGAKTVGDGRAGRAALEVRLVACVREALGIATEAIDPHRAFSDYGVDSIVGVRLVQIINRALGIALRTTVLFDHPSLHALTAHVERDHAGTLAAPAAARLPQSREDEPGADLLERLARGELGVDEAARLLDGGA
jgi:acyl transferase domain-containing protein/SAM-dependent methyltransferase/acyl carrier protein